MGLRHTGRRTHQITGSDQHVELRRSGPLDDLHVEFVGQSTTLGRHLVVGDDDLDVVALQCSHRGGTGDCEAVDERSRHDPPAVMSVKSPMKMASAVATQIAEISQNRMMTVVSGHPMSSK